MLEMRLEELDCRPGNRPPNRNSTTKLRAHRSINRKTAPAQLFYDFCLPTANGRTSDTGNGDGGQYPRDDVAKDFRLKDSHLVMALQHRRLDLLAARMRADHCIGMERAALRSHDQRGKTVYDWRHYLAVVQRKAGASRNGAPFAELPEAFRTLKQHLLKKPGGNREMVDILTLVLQHDKDAVLLAVQMALETGVPTKTHVFNLLHRLVDGKSIPPPILDAVNGHRSSAKGSV
jgi:hypothetical protein